MIAHLPNPFEFNSVESSPADALTVAVDDAPQPAAATVFSLPVPAQSVEVVIIDGEPVFARGGRVVGGSYGVVGELCESFPFEQSTASGLDPTRAAIVFGCMTSWLRTEVRDINNQIALRNLASNSDVSFSRA